MSENKNKLLMISKINIILLILTLFLISYNCNSRKYDRSRNNKKMHFTLYYKPSKEGFSAVFRQYKIMNAVCELLGCSLAFVNQLESSHGYVTDLCQYLDLPSTITCVEEAPISCKIDFELLHIKNGEFDCYRGGDPTKGARLLIDQYFSKNDKYYTSIALPGLPLVIKQLYHRLADKLLEALIQLDKSKKRKKIIVVHWRRGDQIASRCRKGSDNSVNCGGPDDVIEAVNNMVTDNSIIYVATDENASSDAHEILYKAGMITNVQLLKLLPKNSFTELIKELSPEDNASQDNLTLFLTELVLMIRADVFLGWGYTTVNDLVEYERMMAGNSYCSVKDDDDESNHSFCRHYALPMEPPLPESNYTIKYLQPTVAQYCNLYSNYCVKDKEGDIVVNPWEIVNELKHGTISIVCGCAE